MPDNTLINIILGPVLKKAMGLDISSVGPSSLKHAIARRMRSIEIDNTLQYLTLINSSTHELSELIEEVAVNETWFFRDEAPFIALRDFVTTFIKTNEGGPIKLLSIPCSTGEEPYSMAISLLEAGISPKSFTIDAVDISRRSLAIAQQALYSNHSFRGSLAQRHQRYFTKTRQGYALDKSIKGLVRFHRGNLINLDNSLADTVYQVIFCRNLLIYLDASFHQQAINTFNSLLDDNGLLFIGHAESGVFSGSCFSPAPFPKAFAFRKKARESVPPPPSARQPHRAMTTPFDYDDSYPLNRHRTAPVDGHGLSRVLPVPDKFNQDLHDCEDRLRKNGPSPEIFYQLATIFEQKKEWKSAIKMLKKAVYLDPNAIEAIDMLAAIYQRLGDTDNYQACINRGRRIMKRLIIPKKGKQAD
jgi:chemotaxis protein methyltransferase WspC